MASPPGPVAAAERTVRSIRTDKPLPSGRAVLGALLVTVAALVAFLTARGPNGDPSVRYLVATRALAPGQIVTAADVTPVALDLPAPQAASAFTRTESVLGSAARGPVAAGALLTDAVLEPLADGGSGPSSGQYREISVAVPRARALLGNLVPGDRVDVVASADATSVVLVQQALVVAVSSGSDDALVLSEDVVITLALPGADEALAVAHGAAVHELSVLRSTRVTDRLAGRFPASVNAADNSDTISPVPTTAPNTEASR